MQGPGTDQRFGWTTIRRSTARGRLVIFVVLALVFALAIVGFGARFVLCRVAQRARGVTASQERALAPGAVDLGGRLARVGPTADVPAIELPAPTTYPATVALPPRSPKPPPNTTGLRSVPTVPGALPLPTRQPSAPVPPSPVAHSGSLPPAVIRDVVSETLPELRFCFDWQLSQHPELAGRVTMEFTIAQDGSVAEPRVLDDVLGDETVTRCFTQVISRLRFPPPDGAGSVLVRYPFALQGAPEARRPEGI